MFTWSFLDGISTGDDVVKKSISNLTSLFGTCFYEDRVAVLHGQVRSVQ